MAALKEYKGVYYLWKYVPSLALSIISLLLFLTVTILLSRRLYKQRSWFCLAFAFGLLCEVIGYAGRAAAYNATDNLPIYVIQSVFLVIAPTLFAASIYMTLSRIIRSVKGEHLSILRIDRLSRTFIIGDLVSLNVQGNGAGLTSSKNSKLAQIGIDIVVAGLIIQLILLIFFFVTALKFQRRLKREPTRESYTTKLPWRTTLYMIHTTSALIFARSVFRVVEYIQGQDGYSLGHEWTLYAFDTAPMIVSAVLFWFCFPGYVGPVEAACIQSSDEHRESIELNGSMR